MCIINNIKLCGGRGVLRDKLYNGCNVRRCVTRRGSLLHRPPRVFLSEKKTKLKKSKRKKLFSYVSPSPPRLPPRRPMFRSVLAYITYCMQYNSEKYTYTYYLKRFDRCNDEIYLRFNNNNSNTNNRTNTRRACTERYYFISCSARGDFTSSRSLPWPVARKKCTSCVFRRLFILVTKTEKKLIFK